MNRIAVAGIVILFLFSAMGFANAQTVERSHVKIDIKYTSHEPIRIDNNAEFNAGHGVTGGSGTKDDPFIISGWFIDNPEGTAIYIGNTTAYFEIKDCRLNGSEVIELSNVQNGRIDYNVITGYIAVGIEESKNITIEWNSIAGKGQIMEYTLIFDNSDSCWIKNNTVVGGGVQAFYTTNLTVYQNTFYKMDTGMYIAYSSSDNLIQRNSIIKSYMGIYIYSESNKNGIYDNFVSNATSLGILISYDSTYNRIYNNTFYYNNGTGDYYDSSIRSQAEDYNYSTNTWWYYGSPWERHYGNYWREWANNNDSNDPDGDGIVNYPYKIGGDSGAIDQYPLKYTVPGPPMNLTAKEGAGFVNLSWEEPIGDGGKEITEYMIFRDGMLIHAVSATQFYYNDTDATPDTRHIYYVVAVNNIGASLRSNWVFATPQSTIPEFHSILFVVPVFVIVAIWVRQSFSKFFINRLISLHSRNK